MRARGAARDRSGRDVRSREPGGVTPVAALLAAFALVAGGCRPVQPVATPGAVGQDRPDPPAPVAAVDHVVPIRFIEMMHACSGPCQPEIVPVATLAKRVEEANFVFRPAGIQFVIGRVDALPMPSFYDLLDDMAAHPDGNRKRSFAEIRGELSLALPMGMCAAPGRGCPWGDQDIKTEREWLIEAAIHFQSPWEILVWVAGFNNGSQGQMPWDGKSITTNRYDMQYYNFSHEVGHFLGLPHTFSGLYDTDMNTQSTLNPTTGRPIKLSDFWDLVYRPGDPPRYYPTREEAARDEPYLAPKDELNPSGVLSCKTDDNPGCITTCDIRLGDGRVRQMKTGEPLMEGLTFEFPGNQPPDHPSRGFNVMAYFGSAHCAGFGITPSQVLQIRRALTYDMPIGSYPRITGGRPALGRVPHA